MDKAEKESVLVFHGKELLEASGLTYMDIEKKCGRDVLQYRTIYSFFELNQGKAKIDTAARIAMAMETTLNALYTPKGAAWGTESIAAPATSPKTGVDSDAQIIFAHLSKDVLSKLSLELIKSGWDALGELCNQYALGINEANPSESGDVQDE